MTFASDAGSFATPYNTLPSRVRTSVSHGHELSSFRSVTRLPLVTTVPANLAGFARLLVPRFGVTVAVNVPSCSIRSVMVRSDLPERAVPGPDKVAVRRQISCDRSRREEAGARFGAATHEHDQGDAGKAGAESPMSHDMAPPAIPGWRACCPVPLLEMPDAGICR